MTRVIFVDSTGIERCVKAKVGQSLMEVALHNNVPGIDADCGGNCSCATCHVFIDGEWMSIVGPAQGMEEGMLELNEDRHENSRLACQIRLIESLDGLRVTTPEYQF